MERVLHMPNFYPPHVGGVEQVAFDIVESLKGTFEQMVFAFSDSKKDVVETIDGVKIYRCGVAMKLSSQPIAIGYGKKLRKIIRAFNPDIIHFHYPNPFAAHYLLKCKYSGGIIVHYHSDIIKQKILKKLFIGQSKKLLKRADRVIATSPQYIDYSEFLPNYKEKCVMIPNCINNERLIMNEMDFIEAQKIKENYNGKIICLFVGRHVEYKGLTYLIDAADYLNDDIIIRIAGKGALTETLKKQAANKKNIEFIGQVPKLCRDLNACDIFTFPSITKNEAFGIALAEAMWFSKPAVTFYIEGSGVNYVGLKDITCLECENRNAKQFAYAINSLAENRAFREKLGNNAHERVKKLFMFDDFKVNICSLYNKLRTK